MAKDRSESGDVKAEKKAENESLRHRKETFARRIKRQKEGSGKAFLNKMGEKGVVV